MNTRAGIQKTNFITIISTTQKVMANSFVLMHKSAQQTKE
jgi:hypothetical protein